MAGAGRFAHNFHVGAGLAAVSLRENKVSLRNGARVHARCVASRGERRGDGGGAGRERRERTGEKETGE